jgi:two-component system, NarL family, sensor kinase
LDLLSKNIWLYALIGAMILLSAIGFFAYQNNRKRQQLKMNSLIAEQQQKETIAVLQAEENERKRIAADLHDNLGAYAAAISANVKTLKDDEHSTAQLTKQIDNNVQDMVNELGNTIWVLKKEKQSLTEISDRLKIWMQRLMLNYPAIVYDFAEDIKDDKSLSPSHALHLFHILQEGINNALRHANCKHIKINWRSDADWQISIADDGEGFDGNKINAGNGLVNMQQRAAQCGWQVEWQTAHPQGTEIFIKGIS